MSRQKQIKKITLGEMHRLGIKDSVLNSIINSNDIASIEHKNTLEYFKISIYIARESTNKSYFDDIEETIKKWNSFIINGHEEKCAYAPADYDMMINKKENIDILSSTPEELKKFEHNIKANNCISGEHRSKAMKKLVIEIKKLVGKTKEFDTENYLLEVARINYRFSRIHPFLDGNGRTARILTNRLLSIKGLNPILFDYDHHQPLLDIYEKIDDYIFKAYNETDLYLMSLRDKPTKADVKIEDCLLPLLVKNFKDNQITNGKDKKVKKLTYK